MLLLQHAAFEIHSLLSFSSGLEHRLYVIVFESVLFRSFLPSTVAKFVRIFNYLSLENNFPMATVCWIE